MSAASGLNEDEAMTLAVREVAIVCPALLDEFDDVVRRAKFRRWITVADAGVFVERVRREAMPATDPGKVEPLTADPTTITSLPRALTFRGTLPV